MTEVGTSGGTAFVSIIVPCRQEVQWIGHCLDSLLAGDYPKNRLEILVVDGMSDDGTRKVVQRYVERFDLVRLVDNPCLTTPAALNRGISLAAGDVIMLASAHAIYPINYVSNLVGWLERSGADNVGGVIVTRPGGRGPTAQAIACALGHPFGVGNSRFRIGVRTPRLVDTVPFGCYRRSVFDRIGLFDPKMIRNQDDEFNARLIRRGGQILLVPDVRLDYMARDSLRKVARMMFQYGLYKPLAAVKVGRVFTGRQLAPPMSILSAGALAVLGVFVPGAWAALLGIAGAYLVAAVAAAMTVRERIGIRCRAVMCVVFPTLHLSYGVGYLLGVMRLLKAHKDAAGERPGIALSR